MQSRHRIVEWVGIKMWAHRHRSRCSRLVTQDARPFRLMEYPYTIEQIDRQNLSYYYGTLRNTMLSDSFGRLRHHGNN